MNHRSETLRVLRTVLALVVGNALYSLTVVLFLIPSGLITGGATGIALAANRFSGLPVSAVLLVVNVVMLVAGWILLGRRFALSTLASTFLSPLTLAIWEKLFENYVLTDDLVLSTIFAGLGIGISLGIVIRSGGSTGGMDIPPLVLQKYFHIPVAASMTVFDLIILVAQAVSSPKEQVLYGIVLVFVYTIVLDKVILLGEHRTEVKIISTHTDEIRSVILSELDRGVTLLNAEGGYLRQPGQLFLCGIQHLCEQGTCCRRGGHGQVVDQILQTAPHAGEPAEQGGQVLRQSAHLQPQRPNQQGTRPQHYSRDQRTAKSGGPPAGQSGLFPQKTHCRVQGTRQEKRQQERGQPWAQHRCCCGPQNGIEDRQKHFAVHIPR